MEQLHHIVRQREEADHILYNRQRQNGHEYHENHLPLDKVSQTQYLGREVNDIFAGQRDVLINNYGSPSTVIPRRGPTLYDVVLDKRKKEFCVMKDNFEEHRQILIQERNRLVYEQEEVKEEQRQGFVVTPPFTPDGMSINSYASSESTLSVPSTPEQSVHSLHSAINNIEQNLPSKLKRFHEAKLAFVNEREKITKQYNGEYGPKTYEPWQMKDYFMVRGIVEEVVDVFLETYFRNLPPALDRETAEALVEANLEDWKKTKHILVKDTSIQLIMEELVLEITSAMAQETAAEYLDINELIKSRTAYKMMKITERVGTGNKEGRDITDPAYNIITKTYKALQSSRQKLPDNLWTHSQYLYNLDGLEDDDELLDDADIVVLDFHQVSPSNLRYNKPLPTDDKEIVREKQLYKRFQRMEMDYWENVSVLPSVLTLSKRVKGVNICKVLNHQQILVVGTVHGDLILFNLQTEPFRPIRVVYNQSKQNDPVLHIASSVDGSQLLSINQGGVLQCWSLSNAPANAKDTTALGLKSDNSGFVPSELTLSMSMDMDLNDFKFQQGHLAETGAQHKLSMPTIGDFLPTFSLIGKQSCVVAGLAKGDILVCDTHNVDDISSTILFPRLRANPENINVLGQGMTGDLYRTHKHKIMIIGFIKNLNEMVTVDSKAYINIWKNTDEQISSYGWFVPETKYKLDMSKIMYTPTINVSPSTLFTEKDQPGHRRSRQQIAMQRKRVQAVINSLGLTDPWHEEIMDDRGLITQIYPPKEDMTPAGGLFHVIIKHLTTDLLSTYVTRIYKPVKIKATRMIDCHLSDNGEELVFLLLFPSFSPKGPHLTVVVVDLLTRNVKDFRLDIPLTEMEYQKCLKEDVVSSCVSRQYGPTGSAHIFIQLLGSLSVSSLITGNIVVELAANAMPPNLKSLDQNSKITVACTQNKMIVFSYSKTGKSMNLIHGVQFIDNNSDEDRRLMNRASTMWSKHQGLHPLDLRLNAQDYELDDLQHPYPEMMSLVLECMDSAIQSSSGKYNAEEMAAYTEIDQTNKYLTFVAEFEARRTPISRRPVTESREKNSQSKK